MRRALYSFARLPQAMADMPHAAAEPDLNNSVYAMPDRCATRRAIGIAARSARIAAQYQRTISAQSRRRLRLCTVRTQR